MKRNTLINPTELEMVLTEWTAHRGGAECAQPSENFITRARCIARKAETIRRMRLEAIRIGFRALPLPDYLAEVARTAHVSLAFLFPSTDREDTTASPWIAVAREVGMPRAVISLLARLWVAVQHQAEWVPSPVMARQSGGTVVKNSDLPFHSSSDPKMLESKLEAIEQIYPPETKRLLKETLAEIEL